MELLLKFLGAIALFMIAILYGALAWGLVVMKYWQWFAMSLMPTLPVLTFTQCVAVTFLLSLFKNHPSQSIKEEHRDKTSEWGTAILMPWVCIAIAWITKLIVL